MKKIIFKKTEREELKLWVYDEAVFDQNQKRTALIWIHGGGWNSGDPDFFGDDYDYFTKQGAVCFGVEYSLISKNETDIYGRQLKNALQDCIDAVMYVKGHNAEYGIDPERIVIIGESAGGHLALCFATDIVGKINPNALPKAVVAYNPVVETIAKWSGDCAVTNGERLSVEDFYNRYKSLKAFSPRNNIVKNGIPLLLLQGIEDKCVYPGDVVDFYEKYLAVGNVAEIELYPNTSHAFALPFWYDNDRISLNKSLDTVNDFLKKHKLL